MDGENMRNLDYLDQKSDGVLRSSQTLEVIHGNRPKDNRKESDSLSHARDVLDELTVLLSDYSPMWFTQRHSEQAEKAVRELNRLISARQSA